MMLKNKFITGVIVGTLLVVALLAGCGGDSTPSSSTNSDSSGNSGNSGSSAEQINPDENFSVSASKSQVNPGESFTVNIMINSKAASRGAQCDISFDPEALQCDSVQEGGFFKDWAAANSVSTTMMPPEPSIDNTAGTIGSVSIAVMGQTQAQFQGEMGQGAQGSGVFLTLQMTAKTGAAKQANITIFNPQIYDSGDYGDIFPIEDVTSQSGTITVGTP